MRWDVGRIGDRPSETVLEVGIGDREAVQEAPRARQQGGHEGTVPTHTGEEALLRGIGRRRRRASAGIDPNRRIATAGERGPAGRGGSWTTRPGHRRCRARQTCRRHPGGGSGRPATGGRRSMDRRRTSAVRSTTCTPDIDVKRPCAAPRSTFAVHAVLERAHVRRGDGLLDAVEAGVVRPLAGRRPEAAAQRHCRACGHQHEDHPSHDPSPHRSPLCVDPTRCPSTSRPVAGQPSDGLCVGAVADLLDDGGVGERGGVAELAALGDVAEESAHDLAGAGLRQVVGEDDRLRPADLADLGGDVLAQLGADLVGALGVALERDEGDDRLAGQCRPWPRRRRPRPPSGCRRARTRPRWWRCGGPTRSSRRRRGRGPRGSRRRRPWRRRRRSSGPRSGDQYVSR